MSFYNTYDLAVAVPPKQSDINDDMKDKISHNKEADNQENMDEEDDYDENE